MVMASIRKRGDTYQITVSKGRDDSGKKLLETTTFRPDPNRTERQNQKALEAFARDFEQRVKDGLTFADHMTFKEYAEKWMVDGRYGKRLEKSTFARYRQLLDNMLYRVIGDVKLSKIKPLVVQEALDQLRETGYTINGKHRQYSEESIRSARILLSSIMSAAEADELILKNPCVRQRKTKKPVGEKTLRCFTPEQAAFFLDAISKPIPVLVPEHKAKRGGKEITVKAYWGRPIIVNLEYICFYTVAIYSGCRRGELCGLTWENVNFDKGTIFIRQAAGYIPGESYIKAPKTQSGYRELFLPSKAMNLLKKWKAEQAAEMLKLGTAWQGTDRTLNKERVFTEEVGKPVHIQTPQKKFKKLIEAINANVTEEEKKLPVIRLHDLRHTSATILAAQGVSPVEIAHRIGHADPSVTLKIYSHSFAEADQKAADALEMALEAHARHIG